MLQKDLQLSSRHCVCVCLSLFFTFLPVVGTVWFIMRSSNNSRTPATDFVQDYAAKRQAQMDRARQLREERLQQQQQPSSPSGGDGSSNNNNNGSNVSNPAPALTSPPLAPGSAGSSRPPPHVPRSRHPSSGHGTASTAESAADGRVLYVKEADFKQATQAGIITPDQARQLWAMLSNQIIRVCPPSAQNNNTVSVSSLMALSNNSSASSNVGRNSASGGGGGHSTTNANFGASISLESLRTSIAFFKREQQRLKQQQEQRQQQGGGGGRPASSLNPDTVATGSAAAHPRHATYNVDEDDDDVDFHEEPDNYDDEEEQRQVNARSVAPFLRSSPGGRPAWNSDVDIRYADEAAAAAAAATSGGGAAARKKPRTGVATKSSAARPSARGAASANAAAGITRGGHQRVTPRGYDDKAEGDSVYAPSASSASSPAQPRESPGPGGAGRRPPANRAPTHSSGGGMPLNLDDVPVGGGGAGGGGMSDWANAYPPGMAPPPGSRSGGGLNMPAAPQNDAIAAEAAAAAREPTEECPTCGRTFRISVLPRHEALCRKQSNKPRKVFNMRDQRLDGVEGINEVQRAAPAKGRGGGRDAAATSAGAAKGKLPKWKVQHEQFQAAMRAVRQQNEAAAGGGGFGSGALAPPPAPMPAEYDDRVPCPHCGRKFAEDVAARHIPKCATTVAKPKGIRPIRR
jgi:endogenous inhibitor of DNA gyrase (YacG/DUF329 family)